MINSQEKTNILYVFMRNKNAEPSEKDHPCKCVRLVTKDSRLYGPPDSKKKKNLSFTSSKKKKSKDSKVLQGSCEKKIQTAP